MLSKRTPYSSNRMLRRSSRFHPRCEAMEVRMLLSYANGNGPVVTSINETPGSNQLVVTFDGPLDPGPAQDVANYQVTKALANPELVTSSGASVKILKADYSDGAAAQVTLTLKSSLKQGVFYRVFIIGTPATMSTNPASNPLTTEDGSILFNGDNDNTAGGDFYGLFALGKKIRFVDSYGAHVSLRVSGGGVINVWRELDGDIDQLSVIGQSAPSSTLSGSVVGGQSQNVYIGSQAIPVATPLTLNGAADALPQSFVVLTKIPENSPPAPTATSPQPVVATSANLPYSLSISPLNTAATQALPGLQSAVSATLAPTKAYPDGLWLIFGGRTNGLHEFTTSAVANFPPDFQNEKIYVINPATWQTWSVPWTATDVPQAVYNSLSSGEQEFYQQGNTLYTVGGYSVPDTINFTGNTTTGSDVIPVSSTEGLAIGQYLTGSTIPNKTGSTVPGGTPIAITTMITAIGSNTITISTYDLSKIGTATGVALTASTDNYITYDTLTSILKTATGVRARRGIFPVAQLVSFLTKSETTSIFRARRQGAGLIRNPRRRNSRSVGTHLLVFLLGVRPEWRQDSRYHCLPWTCGELDLISILCVDIISHLPRSVSWLLSLGSSAGDRASVGASQRVVRIGPVDLRLASG
jgi:hypothetical protein